MYENIFRHFFISFLFFLKKKKKKKRLDVKQISAQGENTSGRILLPGGTRVMGIWEGSRRLLDAATGAERQAVKG